MDIDKDLLFTTQEVANILKVKFDYALDLIKYGYIHAIKYHGNKVTKAALLDFIEKYDGVDLEKEIICRRELEQTDD